MLGDAGNGLEVDDMDGEKQVVNSKQPDFQESKIRMIEWTKWMILI